MSSTASALIGGNIVAAIIILVRGYGLLQPLEPATRLDQGAGSLPRCGLDKAAVDRDRRMIERRIKAAKFPAVKSLDSFDFKAIPSLNKMQVLELARCEWIERRENVIALGPSGTGDTVSVRPGLDRLLASVSDATAIA